MAIITIIIIAVSLSMDAFSLSLAYGTLNLKKRDIHNLSTIVGVYHFIMPLIGMLLGSLLLKILPINPDWIVFLVLGFVGIEMILEGLKKSEEVKLMSKLELLLFGLAVSIDSFSVGIGLTSITTHVILASLIFSLSSFIFTYLGLILGKKINNLIGKVSTIVGGLVLVIIGLFYVF